MIDTYTLDRCVAGDISPEIALAQLLLSGDAPDPAELARLARPGPLQALADLAERHRDQLGALSDLARVGFDPQADDVLGSTAALFDRLAIEAPEAGVAFYAFGDPASLVAATAELVAVIRAWAPPAGKHVVDLGCGIGRVALALAGESASMLGIDVSAGMVAAAQERAGRRTDVRFVQGNGRDLAGVADGSVDLLLAVDCWPFLVRADAVDGMVAEAARVLAPAGDFLVFNWSYRGDPARDEADARAVGTAQGLDAVRIGARPFAIWDGTGFHFRRPA